MSELGNASIKKTEVVIDDGRDQAVRDALSLAERRHRRELRAALQRLEAEMTREKDAALARQKEASYVVAGLVFGQTAPR